jgi:hypothetical protein
MTMSYVKKFTRIKFLKIYGTYKQQQGIPKIGMELRIIRTIF